MINPIIPLDADWDPFRVELDDRDVLLWVTNAENKWCSGKREDFRFLIDQQPYVVGDYARTVLSVLGVFLR